jgi:hypothetical protein
VNLGPATCPDSPLLGQRQFITTQEGAFLVHQLGASNCGVIKWVCRAVKPRSCWEKVYNGEVCPTQ